jgi:hypothetical protein
VKLLTGAFILLSLVFNALFDFETWIYSICGGKAKFALQQTMKAQMGSRGMALFFL